MRIIPKHGMAVGLAVVVAVAAGACRSSGSKGAGSGRPSVVASFYPLAEAAQRVGGRLVSVTNLTPAGAEPHDLELDSRRIDRLQAATVILELGRGFQPAVEKAAARERGTVQLLRRLPVDQAGSVHEGSDTGLDPHVWLDPMLMRQIVDIVAQALGRADPNHTSTYQGQAADFEAKLDALDGRYRQGLAHCARKDIVTSHTAFGYLARRYGLRQAGIAGIDPASEPNPARFAELADLVKARGVTTIFTETLVSPKVAQALARETGVRTDVLDPLESLSDKAITRGASYVSVMDDNLAKLRAALSCT